MRHLPDARFGRCFFLLSDRTRMGFTRIRVSGTPQTDFARRCVSQWVNCCQEARPCEHDLTCFDLYTSFAIRNVILGEDTKELGISNAELGQSRDALSTALKATRGELRGAIAALTKEKDDLVARVASLSKANDALAAALRKQCRKLAEAAEALKRQLAVELVLVDRPLYQVQELIESKGSRGRWAGGPARGRAPFCRPPPPAGAFHGRRGRR